MYEKQLAWHKKNKAQRLKNWKRWVKKNPNRRRAQALASYHRRKATE